MTWTPTDRDIARWRLRTQALVAPHVLQILDEIYRGYQDSRMVIDSAGVVPRAREAAIGMALVDAQMVAAMKRTVTPGRVRFALRPYDGRPLRAPELAALEQAAVRYGAFLSADAELVVD